MSTICAHDAPAWQHQAWLANDVDEHAAHLRGWHQRYDQLTAGGFLGRLDELTIESAQVFREQTSQALRQRCDIRPDAVWCGITDRHDGSRIDGRLVGDGGVMVCGGAGHFELVSPAGHDILGVVVDRDRLLAHAAAIQVEIDGARLDPPAWLLPAAERRRRAQAKLRAVLALAPHAAPDMDPPPLAQHTAPHTGGVAGPPVGDWARLELTLLDAVVDLLAHADEPVEGRCNAAARRRLVQQVHEWLETHPDIVPSVPQLCERLHVSRRTLQYAFEAETAMSPVAYLRSIRLNGVRRLLRQGAVGSTSVRDAAAAWGFWNLSQFACDYRQQFGERPSETLQRSGASGFRPRVDRPATA
ncbi:helix-turn-helix domain-containing protein [Ideonella sp. DXS29W]|uniref:Helix-turn-helix domain-containing protein n=1 Tax=Ideonella lacteola TaxID=2984193 RepID=A0ABU9BTS1_9BURK